MNDPLPPALDGTALRILSTSDLGATTVPLRTTYGEGGSCAGVVALLERERERQPTICSPSPRGCPSRCCARTSTSGCRDRR